MNQIEKQLQQTKHDVHLLRSERDAMKTAILGESNTQPYRIRSFFAWFRQTPYRLAPAAFALLLVVSVPVAYASQESIPGDFLYSFEINVVEEVEAAFTAKHNRAQYHTDRLEERLYELQMVVNKVGANELAIPVAKEVTQHTTDVLAAIEEGGASEAQVDMLIEVAALVAANVDLLDIAQESDTAGGAADEERVASALTAEIDDYTETSTADHITNTIAENVEAINTLSEDADSVAKTYATNRLNAAAQEITTEDWDETLSILAETEIELRKQTLLNDSVPAD